MSLLTWLNKLFGNPFNVGAGEEIPSPQSIFREVKFNSGTRTLEIDCRTQNLLIPFKANPDVWIQKPPDTNSMDGVFDAEDYVVYLAPVTDEDRKILCDWSKVGDDLIYDSGAGWIIHRVKEIGQDGQGRYFRFAGVNNMNLDPYIVRDCHIKAVQANIAR